MREGGIEESINGMMVGGQDNSFRLKVERIGLERAEALLGLHSSDSTRLVSESKSTLKNSPIVHIRKSRSRST